jgi:uncharacterized coiled-coil DUF342 family protein
MTPNELNFFREQIEILKNIHLDNTGINQANRIYNEVNSLLQELNLRRSDIMEELNKLRDNIDDIKDNPAAVEHLEILRQKIHHINYTTESLKLPKDTTRVVSIKSPILDAVARLVDEKNPFNR